MKFSHGNTTKCAVGSRVSQTAMVFPNVLKLSVGTGLPSGGGGRPWWLPLCIV